MKRFIAMCLAALMIVSSAAIVASAAAADWTPGNGAHIVANKPDAYGKPGDIVEENTPVTVTDGADGVVITHGGYYQTGENWAGVVSSEKYNINGLEVTVRFDTIPDVVAEDDCWICFDLLSQPFMFYASDVAKNPGFMCLARFSRGYLEVYEGVSAFSQVYNSQSEIPGFFAIKSGDVVTVKWDYVTDPVPAYTTTFKINDETFTLPYAAENLVDCFADGKAHIALNCNLLGSQKDAFKYTILNVTDGAEKTQEEIDAVATIRAEKERAENEAAAEGEITAAEERVNKAVEAANASDVAEAIAKAEEAVVALDAAKAAREAGNYGEIADLCDVAKDAAKDAEKLVREANRAAGIDPATGEAAENTETNEAAGESGSNIGLIIAIIAIVVVIIAVVAVVVLKKKKN